MTRLIRRDSSTVVQYLLAFALVGSITERLPLPWFFSLILIQIFLILKLIPDFFMRDRLGPERQKKYEKMDLPADQISFYLCGMMVYQIVFLLSVLGYLSLWHEMGDVPKNFTKFFLSCECLFFFLYQWEVRFLIQRRREGLE